MRKLIGFAMFLVIAVAVIGIYRGWFTVTVNQARIDHDQHKFERKIEHGTEKLKENIHTGAKHIEQSTDSSVPPPPPPPPGA